MRPIRWSDNDRYFGPFTYARDRRYRPLAIMLGSGDGDDYPGCRLRVSAFGHTLILRLPPIMRPAREWVDTSGYPWSRGKGGYWDVYERELGFSVIDGAVHLHFGRQTHDSSTDRSKCWFIPWRQWRHVRRSFYGLNGEHVATLPERRWRGLSIEQRRALWDEEQETEETCPTARFIFRDYDGEVLAATTRIEEREWRLGEGNWRWLALFARPKISRSLAITFSGETGRRKGSWKGGTIGHSIEMLPGELHENAFYRYCEQHDMTFVGRSFEQVPA